MVACHPRTPEQSEVPARAQSLCCARVVAPIALIALIVMVAPTAIADVAAQQGVPSTPDVATPALQPLQPQQPLAPANTDGTESEWAQWSSGRYRITPGDVIELRFPFVPEFNQELAVQPDGYVTLREVGDVRVQGRTLPQLRAELLEAYQPIVHDLVFTVVLKEFEKPYFVAAGEVTRPGRYELRGPTTLTQALAFAGGPNGVARTSEVVIFRHHTDESVAVTQVDVKAMYAKRDLSEDPMLRPGDTIFIPKSTLGKLAPLLSRMSMGLYLNPFDMLR